MLVSLHHSSLTLNYCRRSRSRVTPATHCRPRWAVAPGGRIIIRSGTCPGNLVISRDVRIQGGGHDLVSLTATDATLPVVTVPRGVTATISGVTISGGRVGLSSTGRVALAFSLVTENTSGGIEIRDHGTLDADKIKVTRNKGPGITIVRAEAARVEA